MPKTKQKFTVVVQAFLDLEKCRTQLFVYGKNNTPVKATELVEMSNKISNAAAILQATMLRAGRVLEEGSEL